MTATAQGPLLVAHHLTKTFGGKRDGITVALEDVSLGVMQHEFVSVIGPSGCGKSTLLRIVAGLEKPTSGIIEVDGQRVSGAGADRGMVFQDYALFPWKTTLENVAFGPMLKGMPRAQRLELARRYIRMVGVEGFEGHYPHQLSGGMRQRIAVARALANDPKVLLMDEPFAAVDAITRQRLQEELSALCAAQRTTVLFVTHSVEEAVFLSDRVLVLGTRPGRIVRELTIDLPRPRTWDGVVKTGTFQAARDELLSLLHGGAVTDLASSTAG